tara:strand:- start:2423 stop:2659 length:237 start_codon:yes stop_codon:yes gene_type:complete
MNFEDIEDDDILNCITCDPDSYTTVDKEYRVIDKWCDIYGNQFIRIIDDDDLINSQPITFFEPIFKKRNRIINEILEV